MPPKHKLHPESYVPPVPPQYQDGPRYQVDHFGHDYETRRRNVRWGLAAAGLALGAFIVGPAVMHQAKHAAEQLPFDLPFVDGAQPHMTQMPEHQNDVVTIKLPTKAEE